MGSKSKDKSLFLEQMLVKQVSLAHFVNLSVIILLEFLIYGPIMCYAV